MSEADDQGDRGKPAGEQLPGGSQRVDKWLWFTRQVKSRTLAAGLVEDGKVRLNRERMSKPSHAVRPGDVITLTVHREVRILKVLAAGTRRGPAAEARQLYEDLTPVAVEADPSMPDAGHASRDLGSGRPTKKERRQVDKLHGE